MQPQPGEKLELVDAQKRHLGWMAVEKNEEGLLQGTFTPGADYPAVQSLFRAFEEAVELQALAAVDRLDTTMANLGIQLGAPNGLERIAVQDVQIWSDGGMTCRVNATAWTPLNGSPSTNRGAPLGEDKSIGNAVSG